MINRKIILDTETTGLSPENGDKIIELACIELLNDREIGESFHYYLNPERDIPKESTRIHGITNEMVKDCVKFNDIVEKFLDFIKDDFIIAHNASFDRNFINSELISCGKKVIESAKYIDTLELAKRKFPGKKNSLDALCERFNISLESRKDYHGALIDVRLLADVYFYLIATQENIFDSSTKVKSNNLYNENIIYDSIFKYRKILLTKEQEERHSKFIKRFKNNLWS